MTHKMNDLGAGVHHAGLFTLLDYTQSSGLIQNVGQEFDFVFDDVYAILRILGLTTGTGDPFHRSE